MGPDRCRHSYGAQLGVCALLLWLFVPVFAAFAPGARVLLSALEC
jgi:hypothetical protein